VKFKLQLAKIKGAFAEEILKRAKDASNLEMLVNKAGNFAKEITRQNLELMCNKEEEKAHHELQKSATQVLVMHHNVDMEEEKKSKGNNSKASPKGKTSPKGNNNKASPKNKTRKISTKKRIQKHTSVKLGRKKRSPTIGVIRLSSLPADIGRDAVKKDDEEEEEEEVNEEQREDPRKQQQHQQQKVVHNEDERGNKKPFWESKYLKSIKKRTKSINELCIEIDLMLRRKYPPENRASLTAEEQKYVKQVTDFIEYYSNKANTKSNDVLKVKEDLEAILQQLSKGLQ